jgi:UrcA family protein
MKTCGARLGLIATVALMAAPAAVLAQTTVAPVEVRGNAVRVNYSDLNTNSATGMGILGERVDSAVVTVCRFYRGRLLEAPREFDCRAGARKAAWEQFARNEMRTYASNTAWIELAAVKPIEQ